jgi:putative component of membrane protein insertase Oxa1/YidC/SpoIIIJ protein YidD
MGTSICISHSTHRLITRFRTWQDGLVIMNRWRYTNILVSVTARCQRELSCSTYLIEAFEKYLQRRFPTVRRIHVPTSTPFLTFCHPQCSAYSSNHLLSVGYWFGGKLLLLASRHVLQSLPFLNPSIDDFPTGTTGATLGEATCRLAHSPVKLTTSYVQRRRYKRHTHLLHSVFVLPSGRPSDSLEYRIAQELFPRR